MDIFALAVLTAAGWWIYKCGKRIGSREGYHAGRTQTRHPRRSR